MMTPRGFAALAALCGTVALAGWGAVHFGSPATEEAAAAIALSPAAGAPASAGVEPVRVPPVVAAEEAAPAAASENTPPAMAIEDAPPTATSEHARQAPPSEGDPPVAEPAIAETAASAPPAPPLASAGIQLASLGPPGPAPSQANEATYPHETRDECSAVAETCIDRYLWEVYQRTPKQDTVKVSEQIKVTVTKKGKTRTITKTVTKLVDEDFGWKDPKAAQRAGMPLSDYVIGGMDRSFKLKLYHALRAMDDAGLEPGITSAFRDDYRQSIASGKKAASDSSYHGGSRRGGYGHGMAADLVSVKGATRAERWITSEILWKWVDAHGAEYGVARPYLDRDPPHVGPIDGKEYADKRGQRQTKHVRVEKKRSAPTVKHARVETKPSASAATKQAQMETKRPAAAASRTKSARTAAPKPRSI